jgi:hypothetical protein
MISWNYISRNKNIFRNYNNIEKETLIINALNIHLNKLLIF